jgi:hypothetical protein
MTEFINNQTVEQLATSTIVCYPPNVQATAATTTSLTSTSNTLQIFTGTTAGQVIQLPSATTLTSGWQFYIYNASSQSITINDGSGSLLVILLAGQNTMAFLESNLTTSGVWLLRNQIFTTGSVIFAGPNGQLYQDNAEFFWDNTNYRLGIRTNSPSAPLHVVGLSTDANENIILDQYGPPTGNVGLVTRSARGTPSSPTATQSGDLLGGLGGRGYGATGFTAGSSSQILMQATENWSDTANGSSMMFYTVPNGSAYSSKVQRMTIGNDGTVTINILGTGPVLSTAGVLSNGTIVLSSSSYVSGTLPNTNGGTGTSTAFTQGSVVFAGTSGVYTQNNSKFFWDNTNNGLLLGTNTTNGLDVLQTLPTATTNMPIREVFDDCDWSTLGAGENPHDVISVTGNGGTAAPEGAATGNTYSGMLVMSTGTTSNSTGYAGADYFNGTAKVRLGSQRIIFEKRIQVPVLGTSGTSFAIECGLMDSSAYGDPTNGVFFYYSNLVLSGCLLGVVYVSATSTITQGPAVVAGTWYTCRCEINAAGTSATFYVNGTSIGTITTLPTSTTGLRFVSKIYKNGTASATSSSLYLDYTYWKIFR